MNREQWLALAEDAWNLSQLQQKTYRAGRGDNGKRSPRDLYVSDVFWKYQGLVTFYFEKMIGGLITATSPDQKADNRLKFLSVLVTLIDRFASLPTEANERVDGKSIIPNRGIE